MTSTHKHTTTGKAVAAGDVDVQLAALDARLKKLEQPTPPATGTVKTLGPSTTAAQLRAACQDMTVDVVELSSGVYKLGASCILDIDRSARPLTIRPAGSVVFQGSGTAESGGVFFLGTDTTTAKDIHFAPGFAFSGYTLWQAGVFEIRRTLRCSIGATTFRSITRDPAVAQPYHSWCAYISRDNEALTLDGWDGDGLGKAISFIQIDSGTRGKDISLTNMKLSGFFFAFYENVPTTGLLLDGWTLTDCGRPSDAQDFGFHQAQGTYRNIAGTNAGKIVVYGGSMVNGGGVTLPVVAG